MPRVIAGRAGRTVRVQAQGGASRDLSIAPTGFTADGGAEIAQLKRQGREALTRIDGPKKRTLSFSVDLGNWDWKRSIQSEVDWLQKQRDDGRRIKLSGMPQQFSGWWLIDSMPVEVTQLTPDHQASRATLSFSLVAHLDYQGRVQRKPPSPPRKPAAQPAKKPVTRYHTVKSGDTLSHIALRYLGSASKSSWTRVYQLNKKTIDRKGNPHLIFPGQRFRIPPK